MAFYFIETKNIENVRLKYLNISNKKNIISNMRQNSYFFFFPDKIEDFIKKQFSFLVVFLIEFRILFCRKTNNKKCIKQIFLSLSKKKNKD